MSFLELYKCKLSRVQSFFKTTNKQQPKSPLDISVCDILVYTMLGILNILSKKMLICLYISLSKSFPEEKLSAGLLEHYSH